MSPTLQVGRLHRSANLMQHFFSELRRRRVFRVAAVYAVVAWLIVQIATTTFPYLRLPEWMVTAVIVLVILGFPVALVLAYAFDITRGGFLKTPPTGEGATDEIGTAKPVPADARKVSLPTETSDRSVGVLPFVNLSSDPENEYFSDGITEEILDALSKLRHLRVAARTSSFAFKGKPADVSEVASKLRVGSVLEGSVRKAGDRVRITAQLIDGQSGFHLWSKTFDRQLSDIFSVQAEIARQIADAFDLSLTERERESIGKAPTANITAYDYYLRGRYYFHRLRLVDLEHARAMFGRATEIDGRFSRAYAGLADSFAFLYLWFDHNESHLREAEEASLRALELEPDLAEAHVAYGHVLSLKRRYEEAEAEFTRALRLDPTLFEAYYLYGRASLARGDLESAADLFEEAHRVRPEDYQSIALRLTALKGLDRDEEERLVRAELLRVLDQHLELNPDDVRAVYFRAHVLAEIGRVEEARQWGQRALEMEPRDSSVSYNIACLEATLGNADRAMELLERTVDLGFIHKDWLEHDPDFAPFRSAARFQALLKRLG